MAELNYGMSVLQRIKEVPEYKYNHPTIVLVSNGDVIDYYVDYFLFPWGVLTFLVDPQAAIANTEYCLRFSKYQALSSVGLNAALDKKVHVSDLKEYPISEADWDKFVYSYIDDCMKGTGNSGVEYNDWFFACGNWFVVKHINEVGKPIIDFDSDWIDINGINIKKQRLLLNIETIDQITIRARDWYKVKAVKDIVDATPELKSLIESFIKISNIKLNPNWIPPRDYKIDQIAYKYGEVVKRNGKNYISLKSGNSSDPEIDKVNWKEFTDEIPIIK